MKALRQRKGARTLALAYRVRNAHFRAFLPPRRRKIFRVSGRLEARFGRALSPPPGRRRGCSMRIPAGEERRRNWIGGAWVPPSTDKYDACVNPADTREAVGEFPKSGAADAKAAVDAAAKAFAGWSSTPGPERGRILARAYAILKEQVDLVAEALCREEGKILPEARGEVLRGLNILEFYAGEGFRQHGKTLPSEMRSTLCFTLRQPVGPVALITPWNFPFAIPMWKTAPALVAGCTVVLKPASLTPVCAHLIAEAFAEAGLPPGVLNVVTGRVGDGMQQGVEMGPAVDAGQLRTDLEAIAQARSEGARLLCGGERLSSAEHEHGFFLAPTIFDQVLPGTKLATEEVFGPVLAIQHARDAEEAVRIANDVAFGLTASIYTRDYFQAMRFVEKAEVGMLHVNQPTVAGEAQLPSAGPQATGVGEKEMAEEGANFFSHLKTVWLDYTGAKRTTNIY